MEIKKTHLQTIWQLVLTEFSNKNCISPNLLIFYEKNYQIMMISS